MAPALINTLTTSSFLSANWRTDIPLSSFALTSAPASTKALITSGLWFLLLPAAHIKWRHAILVLRVDIGTGLQQSRRLLLAGDWDLAAHIRGVQPPLSLRVDISTSLYQGL